MTFLSVGGLILSRKYGCREWTQFSGCSQLPIPAALAFLGIHLLWGCCCWGRLLLLMSKWHREAEIFSFCVWLEQVYLCLCLVATGCHCNSVELLGRNWNERGGSGRIWKIILFCMSRLLINVQTYQKPHSVKFISQNLTSTLYL